MKLWIERSQRDDGWWRGRTYSLSLGIEVDDEEFDVIARHGMAAVEVWVSPAMRALEDDAQHAFDKAAAVAGWRWADVKQQLAFNWQGMVLAARAAQEAVVTVGDLVAGTVLESGEVSELVAAEAGIRAGFAGLCERLKALVSFEAGEELIIEPPRDDDAGVSPARWVRMQGR